LCFSNPFAFEIAKRFEGAFFFVYLVLDDFLSLAELIFPGRSSALKISHRCSGHKHIIRTEPLMLDRDSFANEMRRVARGSISLESFEAWFEEESWNANQLHDDQLTAVVFRVESLISAFEEGRATASAIVSRMSELASALRPLEPLIASKEPIERNDAPIQGYSDYEV
jgi:hypothetical protein